MAKNYHGEASEIRSASVAAVSRALSLRQRGWSQAERQALSNLAPALTLIPDLGRWPDNEKTALARIIRAKAGPDESRYVRLLQRHATLPKRSSSWAPPRQTDPAQLYGM